MKIWFTTTTDTPRRSPNLLDEVAPRTQHVVTAEEAAQCERNIEALLARSRQGAADAARAVAPSSRSYSVTDSHGNRLAGPFSSWKVAACYLDGVRKSGAVNVKITGRPMT